MNNKLNEKYNTGYNAGYSIGSNSPITFDKVNLNYYGILATDNLCNYQFTKHDWYTTVYAPCDGIVVIGSAVSNNNTQIEIKINGSRVFYTSGGISVSGRAFKVTRGSSIYVWLYGEQSTYVKYPARMCEISFYTIS